MVAALRWADVDILYMGLILHLGIRKLDKEIDCLLM